MRTLFLACAAVLAAAPLAAQGTIRGVVHDSLRTGTGIAGAEVVLLGAGRRAVADARGRFEFTGVAPGSATLAFWAPWLDSLALPPLQVNAEVRDGGTTEVRLATPALATYQLAVCGAALAPADGILVGEVRDAAGAALEGVAVGARWVETLIGVGQAERRQRAALDTVNATGFYALCGVPTDAEFALVAGSDAVASGEVVLGLGGGRVRRRDLVAGPWDATARVSGQVLGADGRPVAGATVAVAGDSIRITRAAEDGRFVLEAVPRRTTQFVARAIGHVPQLVEADVTAPELLLEPLTLDRVPPELATVTVTGQAMTAGQLQFEHRRELGRGFFVGDAELSRLPRVTSTAVSAMIPRTGIQQTRQGPMLMLRRGQGFCRPRFFIDGYDNGDIDVIEEVGLMERARRVEVYTANQAPPQFNDFNGCGVVVLWTR